MQLNRSDCRGIQEVLGGKRAVAFDKLCQLPTLQNRLDAKCEVEIGILG